MSILADIDFSIEIMHTDKINVNYIMNLIRNIDFDDEEKKRKDIQNIMSELDRADNEELRLKIDLIKNFLEKVIPTVSSEDNVDELFSNYEETQRENEIKDFSCSIGLEENFIKEQVAEYEFSGIINHQEISNEVKGGLLIKKKNIKLIKDFIITHVRKYK